MPPLFTILATTAPAPPRTDSQGNPLETLLLYLATFAFAVIVGMFIAKLRTAWHDRLRARLDRHSPDG